MENFKVGDVVVLAGSIENKRNPYMTISEVGTMINCMWFGINDELHYGSFPAECLIKIK
jgi:uncharacterized protein YodC (DUF2158 family)